MDEQINRTRGKGINLLVTRREIYVGDAAELLQHKEKWNL